MEKKNIDWGNIGFGYIPTDYRYVSNYKDICESVIKGLDTILMANGAITEQVGFATFSDAFTFVLLIVILVFKPTGLFGEKTTDKV